MKLKINKSQLQLLTSSFILIKNGFSPLNEEIIKESGMREYKVSMHISSYPAEIRIGTYGGGGSAMEIARKLFPSARIYSAKSA